MPFGEVMYRCNAHYCLTGVFRNRAVGLVITLALMQLFLFSFLLNGLHSETVISVVEVAPDAGVAELPAALAAAAASSERPPTAAATAARRDDIDRESVGQQRDWTDVIVKSSDLTRKAIDRLKKPALDAVAKATSSAAASSDAVTKLGLNLLASLAKSERQKAPAATTTAAPADNGDVSRYASLAQRGLQMLAGSAAKSAGSAQDPSRVLEMAAQFMLLNSKLSKSGVDPQTVRSVMAVLKSAVASQKLDPRLLVTWMGRAMQMQQSLNSAASGASVANSLGQLLGSDQLVSALLNSAVQPAAVPDQSSSIYRRYVKMTSRGMPAVKSKLALPRLPSASKVVVDLDFKFGIQALDKCQSGNASHLVLVISSAAHTEERQAARDTWVKDFGRVAGERVSVAFVVGQTANATVQRFVEKEAAAHGDLVQTNVQEPVENGVFKTLAGLVWVHRNCADVKQVLKLDDDVYVSAARMLDAMDKAKSEPSITGHMFLRLDPHETDGKYARAKDSWPLKEFPRFMNGGGYLVSRSAVAHLLAAAQSTPVLPVEDVYVTGLCANGARVELIHNKSVFEEEISEELEVCTFEDFASWRSTGPADVLQTWNFAQAMKRSGEICVRTNKCARTFFGLCVPS